MRTSAAAELMQAIWNIFPGDTVRLKKRLCVGEFASYNKAVTVKKVQGDGQVSLIGHLAGSRFWKAEHLVVVKRGPGLGPVEG
jgi:hypothetical protein